MTADAAIPRGRGGARFLRLVLIGAMYAFTALSFEILESVPIVVSGNAHGGH